MTCQLCILTWERDLNWLNVCLRSVQKYWKGTAPLIIATPECEKMLPKVVSELGCRVIYEPKRSDGRLGQQYIKMTSDKYTSADLILHTDSDCMFTKSCSVEDFCRDGLPMVITERYDQILPTANEPDVICLTGYREAARVLLGVFPEHEYMRRHPFLFYTSSIRDMRKHIETKTGVSLLTCMTEWPNSGQISEFNLLGAYCNDRERNRYAWIDTHESSPNIIHQFHSWTEDPNTQLTGMMVIPQGFTTVHGVSARVGRILE